MSNKKVHKEGIKLYLQLYESDSEDISHYFGSGMYFNDLISPHLSGNHFLNEELIEEDL